MAWAESHLQTPPNMRTAPRAQTVPLRCQNPHLCLLNMLIKDSRWVSCGLLTSAGV